MALAKKVIELSNEALTRRLKGNKTQLFCFESWI